jgi:hypothetical protein
MSPILSAIFAAAIYEKAVRTADIEKIYANVVKSAPNRVKNQNDTMLRIIKPPAKESTAKRPDNLMTILLDLGVRENILVNGFGSSACLS